MQGVLLGPPEFKVQRENQDHWVPQVKMVVPVLQGPLETEGLQEPWESQAPRASVVTQERRGNRDLQECQVKEVLQEKMERLGLQDPLVHLVLQETEESRDLQVKMASRVCLEIKGLLESLGNQVTKVFLENLVLWVRLDRGESVEFLGREENWVQQVCRDLKEFLVHLVQMGQRVALVPPVL